MWERQARDKANQAWDLEYFEAADGLWTSYQQCCASSAAWDEMETDSGA